MHGSPQPELRAAPDIFSTRRATSGRYIVTRVGFIVDAQRCAPEHGDVLVYTVESASPEFASMAVLLLRQVERGHPISATQAADMLDLNRAIQSARKNRRALQVLREQVAAHDLPRPRPASWAPLS